MKIYRLILLIIISSIVFLLLSQKVNAKNYSGFDIPNNIPFASSRAAEIKDAGGINLTMYVVFAAIYIMFIHFAVGIKSEFNIFLMVIYFALGGFVGGWLQSYEAGFVFSIILSLIFF